LNNNPLFDLDSSQTLWMDPRGTGLSTPFTADLVKGKSDQELFDYVLNFRADTIGVLFHTPSQSYSLFNSLL
jgi:hypothetical protein